MKKFLLICLIFISIAGYVFFALKNDDLSKSDYLRIHIRANSNLTVDQNVKYEVKNSLVDALYPIVANSSTKKELIENIKKDISSLETVANNSLHKANLNYTAKISIMEEYFPLRVYNSSVTLQSGVYDALIVELGSAEGDNWWCVIYPPLCFMNVNYNGANKTFFASRIMEQIRNFFN